MLPKSTLAVSRLLNVSYQKLFRLVRYHGLAVAKSDSGDYQWLPADIEAAKRMLAEYPGRQRAAGR